MPHPCSSSRCQPTIAATDGVPWLQIFALRPLPAWSGGPLAGPSSTRRCVLSAGFPGWKPVAPHALAWRSATAPAAAVSGC